MHTSDQLVETIRNQNGLAGDFKQISVEAAQHKRLCTGDGKKCSFCLFLRKLDAKDAMDMRESIDFIVTFDKRFDYDDDIYTHPLAIYFSQLVNTTRNIYKFIRTTLSMVDEAEVKCVWGCTRKENLTRGSGVGPGVIAFTYFFREKNRFTLSEFRDSYSIPGKANPCRQIVLDGVKMNTPWGVADPCVLAVFARSHPTRMYVYNADFT